MIGKNENTISDVSILDLSEIVESKCINNTINEEKSEYNHLKVCK